MCLKVGIICAGDREIAPFINHIENVSISEKAMLKIYEGSIHDVKVVALFSGVCKVNAAIATQVLIGSFGVEIVINAGTAEFTAAINSIKLLAVVEIVCIAIGILIVLFLPQIYTDKKGARV